MDPLRVVAAGETATGVALMLLPGVVTGLLFGADATGLGLVMARIAGIALVGLGIACWPRAGSDGGARLARTALLVYSALATLYLSALAVAGEFRGVLLWPAVVVHLVVSVLLVRGLPPRAAP